VIAPSFGPDSRARHESLAEAARVGWAVAHPASLLLDIDTGDDLGALHERLATDGLVDGARAARTRAWLRRHAEAPAGASR
jgi:2-phospho-L-lactate guanylyltransferase (CobY/MobA/RfbA family)